MAIKAHCDSCDTAVVQGSPAMHGWINLNQIEILEHIYPSADGLYCTVSCAIKGLQKLEPKPEEAQEP